jgi:hypothetical protein
MISRLASVTFFFAACAPGPAKTPEPEPEPVEQQDDQPVEVADEPAASPACEAHRLALRDELCGEEPECELDELPCAHSLDFDGDGSPEQVELADEQGMLALRVRFADGREELVGATPTALGEYLEPVEPGRTLPPDWSWIAAWSPAPREGGELVHRGRRFEAGPARGDGLWLSGSDAAAMLVLGEAGWLVLELGY